MPIICLLTFPLNGSAKEPVKASWTDQIQLEGLTRQQAEKLLTIALKQKHYKLNKPGVFIDSNLSDAKGNPPHPGYFDISVGYENPKAGATEYWGLFSVSILTGDIWEINQCECFIFPELTQLQNQIMVRTHKKMADEADKRRGLGCSD